MKLALYLPNFRDKVTVKELEDLTSRAEALDFDSVWTLDRIVVPEASDRQQLRYSFGMIDGFPKALPVSSRGEWLQGMPLIPWLAAKTKKVRTNRRLPLHKWQAQMHRLMWSRKPTLKGK